jgi:hypothetical protein
MQVIFIFLFIESLIILFFQKSVSCYADYFCGGVTTVNGAGI